jgi:hypothetical protein
VRGFVSGGTGVLQHVALCDVRVPRPSKESKMRSFFSGAMLRRKPSATEPEQAGNRGSRGSSGSKSPDDCVCIDIRRDSPPAELWAHPPACASGNGRSTMVGAGNFGLLACSKDDFMQIQTSVMDALSRAEAQFGDDEEFADAIMEEIDRLFDEFEMLKQLLVRAHRGDTDASIEQDALPLKQKLQLGINDIVARIEERERQPVRRRKSKSRRHAAAGETETAGRGIDKLTVEGAGDADKAADRPVLMPRRSVPTTDCTTLCRELESVDLAR